MEKSLRIKKYFLLVLYNSLALLGVYAAFLTYRHHSIVARGIVGFALMYQFIFWGKYSDPDITIDSLLSDPRRGKYIISAFTVFTVPLVCYWAIAQIYEMVLFFWK